MIKKNFLFISLILLTNCTTPTSALLGPIFTGAKTGSVYQASLSYSSGKIINEIKKFNKEQDLTRINLVTSDKSTSNSSPVILLAFAVNKIEISNVMEPEPLP
jgi:hypothetical protein